MATKSKDVKETENIVNNLHNEEKTDLDLRNLLKQAKLEMLPMAESEVKFLKMPTVEVEQSRYENLVACEVELKILKNALSMMNSYDFSGIKRVFGIE